MIADYCEFMSSKGGLFDTWWKRAQLVRAGKVAYPVLQQFLEKSSAVCGRYEQLDIRKSVFALDELFCVSMVLEAMADCFGKTAPTFLEPNTFFDSVQQARQQLNFVAAKHLAQFCRDHCGPLELHKGIADFCAMACVVRETKTRKALSLYDFSYGVNKVDFKGLDKTAYYQPNRLSFLIQVGETIGCPVSASGIFRILKQTVKYGGGVPYAERLLDVATAYLMDKSVRMAEKILPELEKETPPKNKELLFDFKNKLKAFQIVHLMERQKE